MHSKSALRKRTATGVIAGFVSLGLILSGCTSGGGGDDADATKEQLDPAGDINATPADEVNEGGELRFPLSSFPPNWNYNQLDGTLVDSSNVLEALVPWSYEVGLDGAPALNEDLLESVEVTSEDPLVVEYKINPAANWSDGTPITWLDYQNQFTALNGTNEAYLISDATGYSSMESVTQGATEKDAIVTYATPFADWKSMFGPLYPASQTSTPESFNTGYADAIPVTAGPFKLEELNVSARTLSIVPDENWWGDAAKLDRVIFIALDSDADIDAYLNDEIDLVAAGTSERYDRVKDAADTDLRAGPSSRFTHVDFSTSGILADKEIRLAVQKAINRQSLADITIGTLPYELPLLNNHIFLGTDAGYEDNAGDAGAFDADAAKEILEADGWVGDGAVRSKDGQDLEFSVTIPAGAAASSQMAQVIQSQLADVGIKLNIKEVASDAFFEDNVTPGAYDMTIFVWSGTGYYAAGASIYHSGENTQNYGKVSTPEIDALLDEVITEPDVDAATDLWNQIDTLVWEEGHSMPIIQQPIVTAIDPKIANYGARPGAASIDWKIIGFTD